MFENLVWQKDRLLYNQLVFRLQHYKSDDWELGDDCFIFYKIKHLIDQYVDFFSTRSIRCDRLFELGMWEGGSLAFWYEALKPRKVVGIDLADRTDSKYFLKYVGNNGLQDRVKAYWRVNQADKQRLREIVRSEFDGPLDIVIDDASHTYAPTLSSFQTLFPLIRPGGFYIIEDWAWEHWPACFNDQTRANDAGLSDLVSEMVQAAGTSNSLINSVIVYEGFAAIERSKAPVSDDILLRNFIERRPRPQPRNANLGARAVRKIGRTVRGLLGGGASTPSNR